MTNAIQSLGRGVLGFLGYLGQLAHLFSDTTLALFIGVRRLGLVGRQIVSIGFGSQLVVVVTGAFTGAVFAAQTYFMFSDMGLESAVGPVVSIAMCRELGPVLTALMVAGRVGASMAAEIGTMKVTEQVDALRAMGVHPLDYLVVPRAVGMFFSMPLLVAEATGFGILSSYVITVHGFKVPFAYYDTQIRAFTDLTDISIGMIKGCVFGAIIVLVSCHQGLNTTNGAVGVGKSTTAAVVISSLAVLISNFFLSLLLNYFSPLGGSL
ncbi:MAG: ABC transporter permease [Verrucomicrobiae bacterium]|nr:ABC transporter permease [Verrucomicrobiae bacterium]